MPFSFIPTVLGLCFALIWIFIGAMIFRDGQIAVRREREFHTGSSWTHHRRSTARGPHRRFGRGKRPAGRVVG